MTLFISLIIPVLHIAKKNLPQDRLSPYLRWRPASDLSLSSTRSLHPAGEIATTSLAPRSRPSAARKEEAEIGAINCAGATERAKSFFEDNSPKAVAEVDLKSTSFTGD